jgi:L-lactate dehydrogenase complex protein LldF
VKQERQTLRLRARCQKALQNPYMRKAVQKAVDILETNKNKAAMELGNWDDWREHGKRIREHTVENLEYYLKQLAENVRKSGGHVHFCFDGIEANNKVKEICQAHSAKLVVKSKSMVTEEIHLNKDLIKFGLEVVETDLAEYILQLADEPPSHIIVPAIHKNRDQIAELFSIVAGEKLSSDTTTLTGFARKILRDKFLKADIGITGCNFAIADTGSITLVTNEGNARMVTSLPKVHIAIMGMERVVPTFEDFESIITLLPRSATGQKMTSYVSVINGPRRHNELDGADEFHLIILDNGRSNLLKDKEFRQALHCTRCGACYNVCPVYRQIGGHAYGSVYGGPIGSVITPMLENELEYWGELAYATTLCCACSRICSVKIPLHDLLLTLRHRRAELGLTGSLEKLGFTAWRTFFGSASRYNFALKATSFLKPFVHEGFIKKGPGPLASWTNSRYFPAPPAKTFRQLWANELSKKEE